MPTGNTLLWTFQEECAGTLIDTQTVLSAAHCIPTSLYATYLGSDYEFPISLNSFYPTWESMFTIYAGVNDISFVNNNQAPSSPGIQCSISKAIRVNISFIKT